MLYKKYEFRVAFSGITYTSNLLKIFPLVYVKTYRQTSHSMSTLCALCSGVVKGKVVPVHATTAYMGSRGIAPCISNLSLDILKK
jgi:hypothetical protein